MGVVNHGYVEINGGYRWDGVINLENLLRADDGQASHTLFVPGSPLGFLPAFAGRGIPGDVSEECATEWAAWQNSPLQAEASWATLAELREVAWDELSPGFTGEAPTRFRATPNSSAGVTFWRFDGYATERESASQPALATWQDGEIAYLRNRKTRRQLIDEAQDWRALMAVLDALAIEHGPDRLRAVMWFS